MLFSPICAVNPGKRNMPADSKAMPSETFDLLYCWLVRQIAEEALSWLNEKRRQIARGAPAHVFFAAFSAVPRYTGKQELRLTEEDVQTVGVERMDWKFWRADQAGRTLLLLSLNGDDAQAFAAELQKLATCADLEELVALYQSLPLLPCPEHHPAFATEGVRSNMTAVFNAVALRNAYPAEHLDEATWNKMVLKAAFVGSPLHLVYILHRRANPALAHMLTDYAHER
jgi:hypothetical protein